MDQTITVEGMHCAGCEQTVEDALSEVAGVTDADADREAELARVAGAATARLGVAVDTVGAAIAGATVAVGYVIMAALGTFLFAHGIGDTGTSIAPDPVTGVLLAGLVYPAVFGAIGGALSSDR